MRRIVPIRPRHPPPFSMVVRSSWPKCSGRLLHAVPSTRLRTGDVSRRSSQSSIGEAHAQDSVCHRGRSGSAVCSTRWSGVGPTTLHQGLPVRGYPTEGRKLSRQCIGGQSRLTEPEPERVWPGCSRHCVLDHRKAAGQHSRRHWGFREYHLRGLWHTRSGWCPRRDHIWQDPSRDGHEDFHARLL
jgi:hypothetical protein